MITVITILMVVEMVQPVELSVDIDVHMIAEVVVVQMVCEIQDGSVVVVVHTTHIHVVVLTIQETVLVRTEQSAKVLLAVQE